MVRLTTSNVSIVPDYEAEAVQPYITYLQAPFSSEAAGFSESGWQTLIRYYFIV